MRMPFIVAALLAAPAATALAADTAAPARPPQAFTRWDTNGDGIIIREELVARETERANALFDRLDADHDGKITPEELQRLRGADRRRGEHGRMQERMQERIKAADTDGDGRLSRTEAQGLPRLAQRFDALDTDKDGLLSPEELRAARGAGRAGAPLAAPGAAPAR